MNKPTTAGVVPRPKVSGRKLRLIAEPPAPDLPPARLTGAITYTISKGADVWPGWRWLGIGRPQRRG